MTGTIALDPDGAGPLHYLAVRNSYDLAGRLVRVEKGQLQDWQSEGIAPSAWPNFTVSEQVDTVYDALDRKVAESAVDSATGVKLTLTQTSYDTLGRLECTAVRMNFAAFGAGTPACQLGPEGSDGPDRITRNWYDAAGQLLKVQKAVGVAGLEQDYVTYEYTPDGKQRSVTDANGNRAELSYDGHDRQVRWTFPAASGPKIANPNDYEEYGYDPNGNRTSLRKRDGAVLTYAYDALDRVSQKAVPASATLAPGYTVNYGYDNRGLELSAVFAAGGGISNSYDNVGRLQAAVTTLAGVPRTITYAYDPDGNVTQTSTSSGYVLQSVYDGSLHADHQGSTVAVSALADDRGAEVDASSAQSYPPRSRRRGTSVSQRVDFDDRDGFIWFDGKLVPWREANIHVLTHALHYASSVFEGQRIYGGEVFRLSDHSARLKRSAALLGMELPWSAEEIDAACREVVAANGMVEGYMRPVAWRGSEQMGVTAIDVPAHLAIACWPWGAYFGEEAILKGLRLDISPWRRPAPYTAPTESKAAGLYMICTLARLEAEKKGFDDALMFDWRGQVAEGTGANVFFVKDGALHTPTPDCFLNGITRQTVMDLARRRGIEVVERAIWPEELESFEQCFLTGSAAEVTPVNTVGPWRFEVGDVTRQMRKDYLDLVNRRLANA